MEFPADLQKREVAFDRSVPFAPIGLYLGQGAMGLEIVVVEAARNSTASNLRSAWELRRGGRAAPVLLAALSLHGVRLCGPAGDEPPVTENIDADQGRAVLPRSAGAAGPGHGARKPCCATCLKGRTLQ